MELVLENPSLLKKSMEIISDIVLEGTFVFKQDYMELVALNSNNVVMVVFRLLSTNFENYSVKEDTHISLSLEHFSGVLKSCDDKSKLILTIENNKLRVVSLGKNKKEFELSLIDFADENLQKVPNLTFPAKIVSSSANFTNAINDLGFLQDEGVAFKIEKKIFSIEGKTSSMSGKINFSEDVDIKAEEGKTYLCRYSIDYLKKFIKADKIVGTVELSFNNDYPLKIEYKVVDKVLLSFILAPRGED